MRQCRGVMSGLAGDRGPSGTAQEPRNLELLGLRCSPPQLSPHRARRGADPGKCVQTTRAGCPLCLDPKGWARHRQVVWGLSLHKRQPGRTDCTKGHGALQNTAHSVHGALTTNTSTRCPSHTLQHKPHCLTRQLLFSLCLIPKERRLSC